MENTIHRLNSLTEGNWFKLICGASYQHLPTVRSLALIYTLAGVDCIDVAAESAVITAVQEGIQAAQNFQNFALRPNPGGNHPPLLMMSINDGEDPHFRKAEFDATQCPVECPRPCEMICGADAIAFSEIANEFSGVSDRLCYGCGRCLPVCPEKLITTRSYVSTPQAVISLIDEMGIDAIEIHTQVGHYSDFKRLWQKIAPEVDKLQILAISCSYHQEVIPYLQSLFELINPLPCPLIWQTDGRPMSGDIGMGTTHLAIRFARKAIAANLPGYIQLAGGTNDYTVTKLQGEKMLKYQAKNTSSCNRWVSGVAYGSYARSLVSPILEKLEMINYSDNHSAKQLENYPDLLQDSVAIAHNLVSQIKYSSL
ncbi:Fe-S-cluster-containing hydrogenase subunit [Xenococcus sp. PCC 7305]|uniref:circadian clock protein LdpA n=1 Tax=Xenococcus sp. PCC 7305 TaxID=102125 RepID=UPI0002ACBC8C|nr:LdpA C-terminal domain-containing domain [Xenococcus sp. PCC 7305]ELS02384.1 Fe-S-cluster-containing hydrogenase subunit [Xenococcus sp. PCC 7305]